MILLVLTLILGGAPWGGKRYRPAGRLRVAASHFSLLGCGLDSRTSEWAETKMNQALHLPAYPVTDDCIGGVAEFEHTQPWIYGLDNPYLHGVYAPTTLELSESGLRVEGEIGRAHV